MAINYAHLVMLADQKIVGRDEAASIRKALDAIPVDKVRTVQYDGTYEDLFFYIDRLVAAGGGEEVAGGPPPARPPHDTPNMKVPRAPRRRGPRPPPGTPAPRPAPPWPRRDHARTR